VHITIIGIVTNMKISHEKDFVFGKERQFGKKAWIHSKARSCVLVDIQYLSRVLFVGFRAYNIHLKDAMAKFFHL
jgi:hypothetical protein